MSDTTPNGGRWRTAQAALRRLWIGLRQTLPPWTGSSEDRIMGFSVYGGDKDDAWWAPALDSVHDGLRGLDAAWHWVGFRTWKRCHIVRLRTPPGYADIDWRMAHACFALLGEFVETELGQAADSSEIDGEIPSYRGFRLHSAGGGDEKAIDLWLWYRDEYPRLPVGRGLEDPDDVLDAKLLELIHIRRGLWT